MKAKRAEHYLVSVDDDEEPRIIKLNTAKKTTWTTRCLSIFILICLGIYIGVSIVGPYILSTMH